MNPFGPDRRNPPDASAVDAQHPAQQAKGPFEESERWLRVALQNSSDLVMVLETDASIRYVSPAVERVLGYRPEDMLGTRALDYVHPEDLEHVSRSFAEAVKKPGVQPPLEFRVRHKDGSWRHMEAIRSNRLDDPNVAGLVANVRDVTERKRAEERFRSLVQNSSDVILVVEANGRVRYISPAVERILGYKPEEVVGKDNFAAVHPDDMARVGELTAEAVMNPTTSLSTELRLRHKDGSWRHVESSFTSLLEDPAVGGIVINSRDVTERKRAEEALKESEKRFRTLTQNSADVVTVYDAEGRYLEIAPTNPSLLYKPPEDLLGKTLHEVLPREQADAFLGQIRRALETGRTLDMEYSLPVGDEELWFDGRISPMQEDTALFVARDVTKRKRAEEALKRSERYLRTVVGNVPVVLFALDRDGVFTLSEGKALEKLGLRPREVVSRSAFDLYREVPEIVENIRRTLGGEEFVAIVEVGEAAFEAFYAPLRDEGGEVVGAISVATDVTERRRAEEEIRKLNEELEGRVGERTARLESALDELEERETGLRESEERYRAVVEQAGEGILLFDAESKRILETNKACQELFGYSAEEFKRMTIRDMVADGGESVDSNVLEVVRRRHHRVGERRYRRKDGSKIDVEVSGASSPTEASR